MPRSSPSPFVMCWKGQRTSSACPFCIALTEVCCWKCTFVCLTCCKVVGIHYPEWPATCTMSFSLLVRWCTDISLGETVLLLTIWPQFFRRTLLTNCGQIVRFFQDTRWASTLICTSLSLILMDWIVLKALEKSKNMILTSPLPLKMRACPV